MHVDAEFALRTPAAVIVKKFFMILQRTIFCLFVFFFYFINKKNRNKVKLIEDEVYFSTDLRINSLGGPSFVRLPVVGLLGSRVGREKYALLPTHPLALFSYSHLSEGRPHNLSAWKWLFDILQSRSKRTFLFYR